MHSWEDTEKGACDLVLSQPVSTVGSISKATNRTTDVSNHACVRVFGVVYERACVRPSYHLVGGVVGLELLVGGVLHIDGVVSDQRGHG